MSETETGSFAQQEKSPNLQQSEYSQLRQQQQLKPPEFALADFNVLSSENYASIYDEIIGDAEILRQLKTLSAMSLDSTMFVESKVNSETYVLKRLTPESLPKSRGRLELAFRDVYQLRQLSHPNLVKVHGVFLEDDHLFMLSALEPDGNLESLIRNRKGILIEERILVNWFRQLVQGVFYLHSKYIAHGNIKSRNVVFCRNRSVVKLTDFGLAKFLKHFNLTLLDRPGYSKNELYTAPELSELFMGLYNLNQPLDSSFSSLEKADSWSIGVVIYEAAALKLPFQSLMEVLKKAPSLLPEKFSREFQETVYKTLSKLPWQRIEVGEIANEKVFKIKNEEVATPPTSTASRLLTATIRPRREATYEVPEATSKVDPFEMTFDVALQKDDASELMEALGKAKDNSPTLAKRLVNSGRDNLLKDTALHIACRRGHPENVKAICQLDGVDANRTNVQGDTALHVAAFSGNHTCIEALAKHLKKEDLAVNSKGFQERCAIHMAVYENHLETVKTLASIGCNVNEQSGAKDNGAGPLHLAAYLGFLDMIRLLHKSGADLGQRDFAGDMPLHSAARNQQLRACQLLISLGAQVDAYGFNGRTPLIHAILAGNSSLAKTLIELDADTNARSSNDKHMRTPLHYAVLNGNKTIVKMLIDEKCAWLRPDSDGNTAMHVAASKGLTEILEIFIDNGLDIDARNSKTASTCLHLACANGHVAAMTMMLKKRADLEAENIERLTALDEAILNKNIEIARILLLSGAKIGDETLEQAIRHNSVNTIRLLFDDFGAKVNGVMGPKGQSPLHIASIHDANQAAKIFLEKMADTEFRDYDGMTPLAHAVRKGNMTTAEMLWAWGADTEACDTDGNVIIHHAVLGRQTEMIRFLSGNCHVNIDSLGADLKTPLHLAVEKGFGVEIEALLQVGADFKVKLEGKAQTILQLAANKGFAKIVELLIDFGAEVDSKNSDDETALILATKANHVECVRQLLTKGRAKVEQAGKAGRRPLHYATELNSIEIAKMLAIDRNASVEMADKSKETPWFLAARLGRVEIGRMFLKKQRDLLSQVNGDGETALEVAKKFKNTGFVNMLTSGSLA